MTFSTYISIYIFISVNCMTVGCNAWQMTAEKLFDLLPSFLNDFSLLPFPAFSFSVRKAGIALTVAALRVIP